jgi:hypothetical protein
MAYRHGDRNQMQLLPPSIEEYVTGDDPVRAYNAFVDSLSLAVRMHSYEHQTKFRSNLLSASRIGRSQSRNVAISQLL